MNPWQDMKVGRAARLISGVGFPHQYQGKSSGAHPFLKVSDLASAVSGYRLITAQNWVDKADLASLGARLAPKGAIVFPKVGAAMLKNPRRLLDLPAAMDNNLMAVVPNFGEPRFWLYALGTIDLGEIAAGGALPYVNEGQIRDLRIPFPSVEQQRRIADFLDAETARMDKLLRVRNSQLSRLEELWQARLAHRAETLIAAYGLVPLRRVITSIEQGWSPQCEDRQATNSEWAVLKTSAVSTGIFQPSQHKRLPERVKADLRFRIADGDVLMTRGSGSPDHVGVAALAKTEGRRLLLSDLLYRMRLRDDWVPEFMILMLSSKPVRSHVSLLLRGQSGQTIKLRAEDVKSIGIPATPPGSQRQIAEELKEIHDNIHAAQRAIHRSLALLTERRQSLITAAVTGQLDVSTASGRNVTEGVTA